MAIFKRGRVYWYHFVFDGRHFQRSTKQGNPNVARQVEAAHRTALAKGEAGLWEKETAPTLAAFCKARIEPWARAQFERTSLNTWRWYRAGLETICSYDKLANLKLDGITAEHVADFAAHRQVQRRKRKKGAGKLLEVSSVNASLRILRRVFRLALDWGIIENVPKIKLLRGERHRERVISPEEEANYLATAREPLASIATILADTGLRPDEAYRLRWEAISWSHGRNGSLMVAHGKTAAARRVVPLTSRVRAVLQARWNDAGEPLDGWVWPAPTQSGHADHSTVKKQHLRAIKESGVSPFVLYNLRHTFLTRLGNSGVDPWTLARVAGHASITISARYVHPGQEAVISALERFELEAAKNKQLPQ